MDRKILEDNLAIAERHLTLAREHVRRQREIVEKLLRDGHGATLSRQVLKTYEQSLALHAREYDRLQKLHTEALQGTNTSLQ